MPLVTDPAFRGVKDKPDGIHIWRIEKLQVVALPKKEYGKFHSGDSYILLYTNKRKGEYNIHFWLGKETSRDEAGTAAIKSVELDDIIGGFPVQYREVQEHESGKFLQYFKSGIEYLEGGVATGFKKVEKENICRLLKVKGCRQIRVSQVECSSKSMNNGDCFILDLGDELYTWIGKDCCRREKIKAIEVANNIRNNDRVGKAKMFIIEPSEAEGPDANKFFEIVGDKKCVKSAAEGGLDTDADKKIVSLYKVTDAGGKVVMTKVATSPLDHSMLDSKECFIVDDESAIFVWVGKQASRDERANSMVKAEGFLTAKNYPDWTQITRVVEGGEIALFQCKFAKWPYPKAACVQPGQQASRVRREVKAFDVATMLSTPREAAHLMPDDGSGKTQVWRVQDYELVDWPVSRYGIFFQGDSYVILYTSTRKNKDVMIIYFWLGNDSTQDEQGAAAMLTMKLDDELQGAAVQQRVVQGKEPEHFLRIFKGKMIVKYGGRSKGAATLNEAEEQGGTVHLYRVRGTNAFNTRCLEVDLTAASLNSNDVFILERAGRSTFVWCGKGSSGDEREFAKAATKTISVSETPAQYEIVLEGSEPDIFWSALGGKTEYMSGPDLQQQDPARPPRLFHCSNDKGYFFAEEIFDFTQDDLEEDDVMILDTNCDVFLWLGKDSNPTEKKEGLLTLQKYVAHETTTGEDRSKVNQIVVKQGSEPISFVSWFPSWSDDRWEQRLQQLKLDSPDGLQSVSEALGKYNRYYSYEQLKQKPLPEELEHVDPQKKETYLEDGEFEKIFGMCKAEFSNIPQWKRDNIKKQHGLF